MVCNQFTNIKGTLSKNSARYIIPNRTDHNARHFQYGSEQTKTLTALQKAGIIWNEFTNIPELDI